MWPRRMGPMAPVEYRVYVIGPDDHILRRIDLVCEDDDAALARARRLVEDRPVELWRGDRLLGRFELGQ
jgi:hypothetical protein